MQERWLDRTTPPPPLDQLRELFDESLPSGKRVELFSKEQAKGLWKLPTLAFLKRYLIIPICRTLVLYYLLLNIPVNRVDFIDSHRWLHFLVIVIDWHYLFAAIVLVLIPVVTTGVYTYYHEIRTWIVLNRFRKEKITQKDYDKAIRNLPKDVAFKQAFDALLREKSSR